MDGLRQSETPPLASNTSTSPSSTASTSTNMTSFERLNKFASIEDFAKLKKFVVNERLHTSLNPAELKRICHDLEQNHSSDFNVTMDKFRMQLNKQQLDITSPLPFSAFWVDFVKCIVFSTTLLDNMTLGTLHKLVQECLNLPSSAELYSDFPSPAPASAVAYYSRLQLEINPLLSESELKQQYSNLSSTQKVELCKDWEAEMIRYNEALELFMQTHSQLKDISHIHIRYVDTMKAKIDKGILQIQKMIENLVSKMGEDTPDPLFVSFHKAAACQPQFASMPAAERDLKIHELYANTDPTVRQMVQDMMIRKS